MKKIVIMLLIALLGVFSIYGFASAAVTGFCGQCHTMHNSQDNSYMAKDFNGNPTATAYAHLTRSSCLGCHNGVISGNGAPNIFGTSAATETAGGTFAASVITSPCQVHNVRDITWTSDEVALLNATPGLITAESYAAAPVGASQLTCAGEKGCHGRHDAAETTSDLGILGFHHGTYTGYRYLEYYDGAAHTPILGQGSSDWEYGGAISTNHNLYYALSAYNDNGKDSISRLCGMCHGQFHGGVTATDVQASGSWIRHPTENLLSDAVANGWVMASVNIDYDNNPFGFNDFTGLSTTTAYTTTGARVVCVSCHRAHGTPNCDILRWDYTEQIAGSTTQNVGCLGCHHKQRG